MPIESTPRRHRLQIMLTLDELLALDDWRVARHMPSRAEAFRALLQIGLAVDDGDKPISEDLP
jgi:hypothetical protein